MDTAALQHKLEKLIAKDEIREVLYKYCRAVDRGDIELLKSCYHPDGRDDHGFFSGLGWNFAEYVIPILAELELSVHSLSNPIIEIKDNKAYVETHWSVIHRLKRIAKVTDLWHQGRYLDEFEYRDGEWKILNRVAVLDCERSINTVDYTKLFQKDARYKAYSGERSTLDPVYSLNQISSLIRKPMAFKNLWFYYRVLLLIPRFLIDTTGKIIQAKNR